MADIEKASKTIYSLIIGMPILLGTMFIVLPRISSDETKDTSVADEDVQLSVQKVPIEIFKENIKNEKEGIIIDFRTPEEFEVGTIPNAINISFYTDSFSSEVSKLDKTKTYLVFSYQNQVSDDAASLMRALGFQNIIILDGGYEAWINSQ